MAPVLEGREAVLLPTLASLTALSAAAAVLPCGPKPPSTLIDWGVNPMWPMTATPASTTALTEAVLTGPPPATPRVTLHQLQGDVDWSQGAERWQWLLLEDLHVGYSGRQQLPKGSTRTTRTAQTEISHPPP